jgi:monofunctional biosynthetic peptidoglycan transglycosylase
MPRKNKPRRNRPRSNKQRRPLPPAVRWLGFTLLFVLLASWLPVLLMRWLDPPVTAFMLEYRALSGRAYTYQWTDWPALGSAAPLAVMAAEDQRFPDHHGFDVTAIEGALADRFDGQALRGASTITQQVAKNLFLWPGRSLVRKAIEAWFTVIIELSWPKRRILEIYLNIAEFGPGVYGVPAASRIYFAKRPAQLTDAEAALLAAVLPNPKQLRVEQPTEYVRGRQRWIMQQSARLRSYGWLRRLR